MIRSADGRKMTRPCLRALIVGRALRRRGWPGRGRKVGAWAGRDGRGGGFRRTRMTTATRRSLSAPGNYKGRPIWGKETWEGNHTDDEGLKSPLP